MDGFSEPPVYNFEIEGVMEFFPLFLQSQLRKQSLLINFH